MELRPGYKQTEVGVIPDDWDAVPIKGLTPPDRKNAIVDGPFGSNLKTIHYRTSGIPIITSGYVTDGVFRAEKYLYVDRAKFLEERRSAVQPADIVMAKIGERCGASAILPETHETGILSGNALKISVDESRHSTTFVWHVLWHLHVSGQLDVLRTVGAQPALSMANLKRYKIPVPPTKAEQRAIAAALSDVDTLLGGLERLIAKKRDLKQAAMQQLLTGQTRLPGFSGEWELKPLGEIAQLYQPETISQSEFTDYGYPVFGANGVVGMYRRFNHQLPQITISCRGNCGTVNRTRGPAWITGNAMVVNLDATPNIDKAFVYYALAYSDLSVLVTGSGIPQIVRDPLAAFSIALPADSAEQTAIAAVLSDMDAELAALEARRDKTRDLKQAMMQELLTGKTRLVPAGVAHA
jgi:type I restriction enzyme S subunit